MSLFEFSSSKLPCSTMLPRLTAYNNVGITSKASEEIRRESTEDSRFRQSHCRLMILFICFLCFCCYDSRLSFSRDCTVCDKSVPLLFLPQLWQIRIGCINFFTFAFTAKLRKNVS